MFKPKLSSGLAYILLNVTLSTYKEVDNIAGAACYQFIFLLFFGYKAGRGANLYTIRAA